MRWPACFLWERFALVRPAEHEQGAELRWGAHAHNPHGSVAVYLGPQLAEMLGMIQASSLGAGDGGQGALVKLCLSSPIVFDVSYQ
ncbi:hypothetical protein TSOC_011698 [Tetrabaena socialis]|uniref:Uncharacterized protein n=1 Tax=Tetrabaena socialis TaxID=47790 RepID=A0A2J7ZPZ2_9CHLO|nr:hypothetical protein TSOC_011698 [Tetrabaena socialis]|eukprot:PNH02331.1 hypothetical protein TSOC_011698 [Tetrabaena socialis]